MLVCKLVYLHDLGFGYFECEYATNPLAPGMHVQHHLCCAVITHVEKQLQNLDYEIHGRVIVIQQYDTVHRRQSNFRPGLFESNALFFSGFEILSHGLILTEQTWLVDIALYLLLFDPK